MFMVRLTLTELSMRLPETYAKAQMEKALGEEMSPLPVPSRSDLFWFHRRLDCLVQIL